MIKVISNADIARIFGQSREPEDLPAGQFKKQATARLQTRNYYNQIVSAIIDVCAEKGPLVTLSQSRELIKLLYRKNLEEVCPPDAHAESKAILNRHEREEISAKVERKMEKEAELVKADPATGLRQIADNWRTSKFYRDKQNWNELTTLMASIGVSPSP